ncbi:Protein ImuB [BD1-7 clade bacterium]|uniref:Protein ImuB n=1 Tax=BD1-7 clade bacterium TaxID=2029982 RepID=A0A5S9QLT9_9GAMM|nr:Protein ImuB [BD1-7 clade bacterium]
MAVVTKNTNNDGRKQHGNDERFTAQTDTAVTSPTETSPTETGPTTIQPPSLWLYLRFDQLSLNALGIDTRANASAAAIIDQQRVHQCNASAAASGIRKTMTFSHARMTAPDVTLHSRALLKEQQQLSELAGWAYRYSPMVTPHKQGLLMDIGGCLDLFQGFDHLLSNIQEELAELNISYRIGSAHTPKGAVALSFCHDNGYQQSRFAPHQQAQFCQLLRQVSIDHLDIDDKQRQQLYSCGFEYVDDFIDIPAAELGQRFGSTLLDYLQRLLGTKADPQSPTIPPETFRQHTDFAEPIHNQQWIDEEIRRLLQSLCEFLRKRQLHCRGFDWYFFGHNQHLIDHVHIALAARQNTLSVLKSLSDLQISKLDLRRELMGIELVSTHVYPLSLLPDDFFDTSTHADDAAQLIDRLRARLGPRTVYQPALCAEHLPELQNLRCAPATSTTSATSPANAPKQHSRYVQERPSTYLSGRTSAPTKTPNDTTPPALQPLWLLPKPRYLSQKQQQPWYQGPLRLINGPDRITSHWWSGLQYRDYFIARQHNGRLLWVFYEHSRKSWYLHGFFA